MKKIILPLMLGVIVTGTSTSYAEDTQPRNPVRAEVRAERAQMRSEIKDKVETMHLENKEDRAIMREERKENRAEVKTMREEGKTKEEIKAKIEEVRIENKAKREEFKVKIEEKRAVIKESIKEQIKNFKEGKKVKLDEARKEKVTTKIDNIEVKLNAALERITAFDKKISEIIANRKAKGLDTSTAESNLELARQALEEARVDVNGAIEGIEASLNDTEGASKEALRSVITGAVESIKEAKAKYDEVIKSLPKVNVETTASTTVTN